MYAITSDLPVVEKLSLGADRWAVYAALLLAPSSSSFELTTGYIITRGRQHCWSPWFTVVGDEVFVDADAIDNIPIIGDARDLDERMARKACLYSAIDPVIEAEGLDGGHQWTVHRGLLIKPAAGLALPGYVVSYRDGSVWTDCWPVDDDGQLVQDPDLYVTADVIGRVDMDKLDV